MKIRHRFFIHSVGVKFTESSGERTYDSQGNLHSQDDKPALIDNNFLVWMKHGAMHRDHDRPAFVGRGNNWQEWYRDGKKHRDGLLPAVINPDGSWDFWKEGAYLASLTPKGISKFEKLSDKEKAEFLNREHQRIQTAFNRRMANRAKARLRMPSINHITL